MNGSLKRVALLAAALAVAVRSSEGSSNVPRTEGQTSPASSSRSSMPQWQANGTAKPACPLVTPGPPAGERRTASKPFSSNHFSVTRQKVGSS